MRRYGRIIKIKPDKLEKYKKLNSEIWPEIVKAIHQYKLQNFSIFHKNGLLFSYFEYIGEDFENDTKKMASVPEIKKWLNITDKMQDPLESRLPGEWWEFLDEIFHLA